MKNILIILLLVPYFTFSQITPEQIKPGFSTDSTVTEEKLFNLIDFIGQKVDTVPGKVLIDQEILSKLSIIEELQESNYQYIFVNSAGNDANDGSTPELSVSSITRANAIIAGLPGNRIPVVYLARGDLLVGQLEFNKSGTVDSRAKVLPYGDGDTKPVISGAIDLAALTWVDQGSNVWRAIAPAPVLNVWKGDIQQTIARENAVGSYHTMTRAAGVVTIPTLDRPSGEVTGSTMRMRETKYSRANREVASWDNTTKVITFTGTFENWTGNVARLGYFDGAPEWLDVQDEWAYVNNAGTHEVYVYSTASPSTFTNYRGSIHDYNINLGTSNISYVDIEGVALKYAGLNAINFDPEGVSATLRHLTVNDVDVSHAGKRGVHVWNNGGFGEYIEITDSNIWLCGVSAAFIRDSRDNTIERNHLHDIFTQQAYGFVKQSEQTEFTLGGYAITILSSGQHVTRNEINHNRMENLGGGGLMNYGGGGTVSFNYVNNFALKHDDIGGLYCWGDRSFHQHWHHNIIKNGIGTTDGYIYPTVWSSLVVGMYFDNNAYENHAHHNTVINIAGNGVMLNYGSRRNQISYNTIAGCSNQIDISEDAASPIDCGHVITNNALISLFSGQVCLNEFNKQTGIDFTPGYIDYNHYIHPTNRITHTHNLNSIATQSRLSLSQYQDQFSRDENSTFEDIVLETVFDSLELGTEKILVDNNYAASVSTLGQVHVDDGDIVWNARAGGVAVVTHHSEINRDNYTVYHQNAQVDQVLEKGKSYLFEFAIRSNVADTNYAQVIIDYSNNPRMSKYMGFDGTRRVCQMIYTHTEEDFTGNYGLKIRTFSVTGLPFEYDLEYMSFKEILYSNTIQRVIENATDKLKSFYPGYTFTDESGIGRHVSLEPFESAYFQYDGTGYKKIKP